MRCTPLADLNDLRPHCGNAARVRGAIRSMAMPIAMPTPLGRPITDWAGAGNPLTYRVRFTEQTWPEETLATRIVVTGKERTAQGQVISTVVSLVDPHGAVRLTDSTTG